LSQLVTHEGFTHEFFMEDGEFLRLTQKVEAPTHIVHGKYDHLCPVTEIAQMTNNIKDAKLTIMDDGHSASDPGIERVLMEMEGSQCHTIQ